MDAALVDALAADAENAEDAFSLGEEVAAAVPGPEREAGFDTGRGKGGLEGVYYSMLSEYFAEFHKISFRKVTSNIDRVSLR